MDKNIKTIVFDLGGVILDLSVNHTLDAIGSLSNFDRERVMQIFLSSPEFEIYEKGGMSDVDFRNFVRTAYAFTAPDEDVDKGWNAMLRGIPAEKLVLLKRLMQSHQTILLSNTNSIHLDYINNVILPPLAGVNSLDPYFHKTYYSHFLHKRKPDAEIFEQVLQENNLVPSETLFLDDNELNVNGARAVGIQTVHVTSPDLILAYFNE